MTDLATLVAKGITAEALVEVLADQLDRDWQDNLDRANDMSDLIAAGRALTRAEALAPYRALVTAMRDAWAADRDAQVAEVVPVRSS